MTYDILFSIMAKQEVTFFLPIAKRLMAEEGLKIAFLTFHEAGDQILDNENIDYFSIHKIRDSINESFNTSDELKMIENTINVNYRRLILHEMLTANRTTEQFLASKVVTYYKIIDRILRENQIRCVIQELGGFIAPQLLFYLSRYHHIDHAFIEPAMFPRRVVFTMNAFQADISEYRREKYTQTNELDKLLNGYLNQRTVVIPKKDKHFFQDMTLKRLCSADNFRRLFRKLYHKYGCGIREEYDAIGWYVLYHLIKWFRRQILRFYYKSPSKNEMYVYYPFHVPLDVQLTVRCPEFLDQEALVQYIAHSLPSGCMLYIKEHPASIGGHSLQRMKRILKLKNVKLIHPRNNSFDLIKNALCVVTINSKVGFEAIMQKKPVVVLGKTFYRNKGVTVDVEKLSGLPNAIAEAVTMKISDEHRMKFLNGAIEWSCAGELYENSNANVNAFYHSLRSFLGDHGLLDRNKELQEQNA